MKKLFLQIAPRYGNLALASLTSYGRFPKSIGILYVNIIKSTDEIRYELKNYIFPFMFYISYFSFNQYLHLLFSWVEDARISDIWCWILKILVRPVILAISIAISSLRSKMGTCNWNKNVGELNEKIDEMITWDTSSGLYMCNFCSKTGKIGHMREHVEIHHVDGLQFPCKFCGKSYRSRATVRAHVSRDHRLLQQKTQKYSQ